MQTIFNIINRFVVDDRATKAMNRMAAASAGLNSSIMASRSALGTLFMMGGTIGAFMALNQLKKGFYDYNAEMEQSEIALAAIFNAGMKFPKPDGTVLTGIDKFNNSLGVAQKLMQDFQTDAALSVGTTADFVMIAKHIASPLLKMGVGVQGMEDFTRLTVNAASVMGVDFPQAARDMMSSLTGVAGIDVKLFRLLDTGMTAKDFNAMAPIERYKILVKAMEQYQVAGAAYALSMKGSMSTMVDLASIYMGRAGRHPFETFRSFLADYTKDAKDINERMTASANKLGEVLSKITQATINIGKGIYNNMDSILTGVSVLAGARMFGRFLPDGMTVIGFGRRVSRRTAVAAGRYGPGLMRFPGLSLLNLIGLTPDVFRGIKAFPMLSLLNIFQRGRSVILPLIMTFGRLLGYFSIAGIVIMFFANIINVIRKNVDGVSTHLYNAFNRLIGVIMRLAGGSGSPLGRLFGWLWALVEFLVTQGLHGIALFIEAICNLVEVIAKNAAGLANIWRAFTTMSGREFAKQSITGLFSEGYSNFKFDTGTDYLKNVTDGYKMFSTKDFMGGFPEAGDGVPQNNTTINGGVHIYQEFKENHEPDRIAFKTVELLNRLAVNPVQPKRAMAIMPS